MVLANKGVRILGVFFMFILGIQNLIGIKW